MATKVYKLDLQQLIKFIDKRHVAVPEFQRGYVWKTKQIKNLFDSLIKKYPVGSVILWETNQKIDARTLDGEPLPRKKFLILDGQQRMTSLYYLSKQKKFVEPHVKNSFHMISDSKEKDLVDFEKFVITKGEDGPELTYNRDSSCKLEFKKLVKHIGLSYKFPVITISLDDYKKAIQVFERINQAGTRISTESIFLSETWNNHSNISKVLRKWKKENKGTLTSSIDTVIFIHSFCLILQMENKLHKSKPEIGIDILKKIAKEISESKSPKYDKIFTDVIKATADSIDYLRNEYGIVNLGQLPSQTMVTVLSTFFYYQRRNLSFTQKAELKKWFWRSSLGNRYIGAGYSLNTGADSVAMKELAQRGALLNIPKVQSKIFSRLKSVDLKAGRSTYRNIIKQALWQQKPLFINGNQISRADFESGKHNPEDDHFFPADWHKKGLIGQEINNIVNIHLLDGSENVRKSNKYPSVWIEQCIQETGATSKDLQRYFESQLLPFRTLSDVKRHEKFKDINSTSRKKNELLRAYERFLYKRYKLIEQVLMRLQDGKDR